MLVKETEFCSSKRANYILSHEDIFEELTRLNAEPLLVLFILSRLNISRTMSILHLIDPHSY